MAFMPEINYRAQEAELLTALICLKSNQFHGLTQNNFCFDFYIFSRAEKLVEEKIVFWREWVNET